MRVKCDVCGKIENMDYLGNGMYQYSEGMREHDKKHRKKVNWEVVGGEYTTVKDILYEHLAKARTDRKRELITKNIQSIEAIENYNAYISVWNCRATLFIKMNNKEITDEDLAKILTKREAKKLEDLIYESVDEFGAINWSGWYGITERLASFLDEMMKKYKDEIKALR